MGKNKEIDQKKKDILDTINDIKVNMNVLNKINRHLSEEKRQGFGFEFHEKDIKSKKKDIMTLIRREEELLSLKDEGDEQE
jgi:hypothetical protein